MTRFDAQTSNAVFVVDDRYYTAEGRDDRSIIGGHILILTRRVGRTVMIGEEVTITVLGVKGNQVRVGINAPKSVAVHREEIYERIKREQQGESSDKPKHTAE